MRIKTIYIFCWILISISCKKEYSIESVQQAQSISPTIQLISNTEIITVGTVISPSGEKAAYWIDSNFYYVEPDSTSSSRAIVVEKWNGNLIIFGSYRTTSGSWQACYWVNGQRYKPSTTINDCHIQDAKIYNNALYILSYENGSNNCFLGKMFFINGVPQTITLTLPNNANVPNRLYASNMAVANNKLFVFGHYQTVNNSKPCIWEIDESNNVTTITPEKNINNINFSTYCGDAKNSTVYLIGDSVDSIYIWTKDGRFMTLDRAGFISNIWNGSEVKIDDNGDLYFLYTNTRIDRAQLYKITSSKQVTTSIFSASNNYRESSFGLDILGNVYIYGIQGRDITNNRRYGFVQKNNNQIPLKIPNNISDLTLEKVRIFFKQ